MSNSLSVNPPTFEVGSMQTIAIPMDATDRLETGDVIANPVATLTVLATGAPYADGLVGEPQVDGWTITQTVTALQAGVRYRLILSFDAASVGTGEPMELELVCVF